MTFHSVTFNFRRNPLSQLLFATAVLAFTSTAIADTPFGVVGSGIDLSANVMEFIPPGSPVFQDNQPLFGTQPSPVQTAELLHIASKGQNLSGRSTNITGAFASSLAESDGNGGVGVSSWIAGNPGNGAAPDVGQLVAQSLWTQTFAYNGVDPVDISLNLHIPSLQVQLIGVAPNRDSPSATETASAIAMVTSLITHSDGSFTKVADFEFGLKAFESQIQLGLNNYANFGDLQVIDVGTGYPAVDLFSSLQYNGIGGSHNFNPKWTLDSVSTSVKLGTLQTGDILSYIYTLTAQGTTLGGEHGYDAFLGDPFGLEFVGGSLTTTVTSAVPIPSTYLMMLTGFALISCLARKRTSQSFQINESSIYKMT